MSWQFRDELDQFYRRTNFLELQWRYLMTVIDQLKADDEALKAVVAQVVTKFADLSKQLSDALAANDPVALAAVAADMEAATASLKALVPTPAT